MAVASPALFVTAVLAFALAIKQTRESENTRVANLYSTIEERWASQQIRDSLTRIYHITSTFDPALSQTQADYFDAVLSDMSYSDYIRTLGILDFFEYIGMMVDGGYINVADVSKLMRSSVITVHELMLIHIDGYASKTRVPMLCSPFSGMQFCTNGRVQSLRQAMCVRKSPEADVANQKRFFISGYAFLS